MDSVKCFEMNNRGKDFPSFEDLVKFICEQIKILQRTGTSRKLIATQSETSKRSPRSSQALVSLSQVVIQIEMNMDRLINVYFVLNVRMDIYTSVKILRNLVLEKDLTL